MLLAAPGPLPSHLSHVRPGSRAAFAAARGGSAEGLSGRWRERGGKERGGGRKMSETERAKRGTE
eukprot:215816-Rhodomonas_salina.1